MKKNGCKSLQAITLLGFCMIFCSCKSSISITLQNPDIDLHQYKNVYIVAHNTCWDINKERKDEFASFISSTCFGVKDCFRDNVLNDAEKLFGEKDTTFIPYYLYINGDYKKDYIIKSKSLLILDEFSRGWCSPYGRPWNIHYQYRKKIALTLIDINNNKELAKLNFNGNYFRSGAKEWKTYPEQKMLETLKKAIETKQVYLEIKY